MRSSINISNAFSKATKTYDEAAEVQQLAAKMLITQLNYLLIPHGPIWEIGCGTGFLTESLVSIYPFRNLRISDLSKEMLSTCKKRIDKKKLPFGRRSFIEEDSQKPFFLEDFALIISNFCFQWFNNLPETLESLFYALKEKGILLFSFLEESSFPEWKRICKVSGIPYTGNPLPTEKEVTDSLKFLGADFSFEKKAIKITFPSSFAFFKSLKQLGAQTSTLEKKLTFSQFHHLMRSWDTSHSQIDVTYSIFIGVACHKKHPLFHNLNKKVAYAIS